MGGGGTLLLLFAPLPPSADLLALEKAFSRRPTTLVILTVPGDLVGSQTFNFSPKLGDPITKQLGVPTLAILLGEPRGQTTRIEPDKAVTRRPRLTLNFADLPDAPEFDSSVFSVFKGSTFWRRLVLAQPDLVGSAIEVKRGFIATGLVGGLFETIFKGRVEDFNFSTGSDFSLVIQDIMNFVDQKQPRQISDDNLLNESGGLTAVDATITVDKGLEFTDPAFLKGKDFFPVILRVEPDSINVALTSASWTAATFQIKETDAFLNYVFTPKDQIFLSHASITDGLFEINRRIDNDTIELSASLFATDLTGVVSEPREDIVLNSISGNNLLVQANFLTKSEDFGDSAWAKTGGTGVTTDSAVGPFGGDLRADLLAFAAIGDRIEQDSGEPASDQTFTFSVWLRAINSDVITPPGTIELELILADATQLVSLKVNVTADWQRLEITKAFSGGSSEDVVARITRNGGDLAEVTVYGAQLEISSSRGFYAATNGSSGAAAGRGQFGTPASAHTDRRPLAEVIPYRLHQDPVSGVHPIFVVRDLVNRGGIAVADVDQASFDAEFAFEEGVQARRADPLDIRKPRKLSQHLKEVRQQFLIDLWVSEKGLIKVRLSFRQNLPGTKSLTITDADNILFRSTSYQGNKESRITEAFVHYDPFPDESDPRKGEDFRKHQIFINQAVETLSGIKAKELFSKWIFRQPEAAATAGRLVGRFSRGARIATFRLDIKDTSDTFVGDVIILDSEDVPAASFGEAVRARTNWQVISKQHRRSEGLIELKGLEFSGLRHAIISENLDLETPSDPFPDYPAASGNERQFGFISDNDNKIAGALTTAPFTLAGATYTAATKRITEVGAFAGYTFVQGDAFFPIHASAHSAFYLIDSRIDDDTIELSVAIKNVSDGVADSGDLTALTNDTTKWRSELELGYFIL